MKATDPVVLVILDGLGYSKETEYNAVYHSYTPQLDHLLAVYPHTFLQAAGKSVGLLEGEMGNSEVGHLTIGSGRTIRQSISIIHNAIENKTFFKHELLRNKLKALKRTGATVHIMGLLSDAGIHSHEKHIFAFLDAAYQTGITNLIVHAFLDGRDTPPKSAAIYLQRLENKLTTLGIGKIGSLHGRFYAMDRDNNWQRTEASYRVLTEKQTIQFDTWQNTLEHYYNLGITDEFIPPTQLKAPQIIHNGDGVIFSNFRADRARQLTRCFTDPNFHHFPIKHLALSFFTTPTNYGIPHTDILFLQQHKITNTLKEVLSHAGKSIFSIAETEKYAHITYFFSGGREKPFPQEEQVLIKSIPAKNYIAHPEMSAKKITAAVIQSLQINPKNFYLINYANPDMVGHSGNFEAIIKAIECVDREIKKLYDIIINTMNGTLIITADHGNAEDMFDQQTKQPKTAHTNNPVYFILIHRGLEHTTLHLPLKTIADIAPFILKSMGIPIPKEMKR
jgi:2,3-bisphosphoglycerate-independent phosphoglycerate mutase